METEPDQLTRDELAEELIATRKERDAALERRENDPQDITQKAPPPDEEETYLKPKNVTKITASELYDLLEVSPDEWNDIRCCVVHNVLGARLKWERPWSVQKTSKIDKAVNATNATFPFLRRFESSWVTRWLVKSYWKSRQDYMRLKRQGKVKSRKIWPVNHGSRDRRQNRRETPQQHNNDDVPTNPSRDNTPANDFDNDMEGLELFQEERTPHQRKRLSRGSEQQPPRKKKKIVRRVVEEEVTDDGEGEDEDEPDVY